MNGSHGPVSVDRGGAQPIGALRTRTVQVDGRRVRVLERGPGPPGSGPHVVLVHGLGLSAGVWRPHLAALAAAGYHALAPDLPGFGRSHGRLTGLSVPESAEWLDRFASAVGVERAAWVGHSVGTQQVGRLAVSRPERVAALVMAAPTGRAGWHVLRQLLGLAATAFQEPPPLVADVVRRYLLSPLTTVGTWIRSQRHDLALDAPRIACPVLLVTGSDDGVVLDRFVDRLAGLLPSPERHRVEGATHAVALDPLDPFLGTVTEFLDRRYRPGSSPD